MSNTSSTILNNTPDLSIDTDKAASGDRSEEKENDPQPPTDIPHVNTNRPRRPIFDLEDDFEETLWPTAYSSHPEDQPVDQVSAFMASDPLFNFLANGVDINGTRQPVDLRGFWVETPLATPGGLGYDWASGRYNTARLTGLVVNPNQPLEAVFTLEFLVTRLAEYRNYQQLLGRLPFHLAMLTWERDTADFGAPFFLELLTCLEHAVARGFGDTNTPDLPTPIRVFDFLILAADIEDYAFFDDGEEWVDTNYFGA